MCMREDYVTGCWDTTVSLAGSFRDMVTGIPLFFSWLAVWLWLAVLGAMEHSPAQLFKHAVVNDQQTSQMVVGSPPGMRQKDALPCIPSFPFYSFFRNCSPSYQPLVQLPMCHKHVMKTSLKPSHALCWVLIGGLGGLGGLGLLGYMGYEPTSHLSSMPSMVHACCSTCAHAPHAPHAPMQALAPPETHSARHALLVQVCAGVSPLLVYSLLR